MGFINWIVRFKHPMFWIGLVGLFFATIGVEASTLTTWPLLIGCLKNFISNPFAIGCAIVAVIGYITDFTTEGVKDSKNALTYVKPARSVIEEEVELSMAQELEFTNNEGGEEDE